MIEIVPKIKKLVLFEFDDLDEGEANYIAKTANAALNADREIGALVCGNGKAPNRIVVIDLEAEGGTEWKRD